MSFAHYLIESNINKVKTHQPIEVEAYRYETGTSDKVKFYSKEEDYAISYARGKLNIPSNITDADIRPKIKKEKLSLKNPMYVEMGDNEFSDERIEKKYIDYVMNRKTDFDSIVFHQDIDEFYVVITK